MNMLLTIFNYLKLIVFWHVHKSSNLKGLVLFFKKSI